MEPLDLIDHGIYGLHSEHRPGEQVTVEQVTVDLRALARHLAGAGAGRGA